MVGGNFEFSVGDTQKEVPIIELIRTMEERMTKHFSELFERMDKRAEERHLEMDKRSDERHREVIEAIRAIKAA